MSLWKRISITIAALTIVVGITMIPEVVNAQDTTTEGIDNKTTIVEVKKLNTSASKFLKFYNSRLDQDTGALKGPLDVIVGTTDKGVNGVKYSNVPFVIFSTSGFIAFHNGDSHEGKPVYLLTSNYTIRMK